MFIVAKPEFSRFTVIRLNSQTTVFFTVLPQGSNYTAYKLLTLEIIKFISVLVLIRSHKFSLNCCKILCKHPNSIDHKMFRTSFRPSRIIQMTIALTMPLSCLLSGAQTIAWCIFNQGLDISWSIQLILFSHVNQYNNHEFQHSTVVTKRSKLHCVFLVLCLDNAKWVRLANVVASFQYNPVFEILLYKCDE